MRSEDADLSLACKKTLETNNGSLGWHPGPDKVDQKVAQTCPDCDTTPENPKPKTNFFSISTRRLAESVDALKRSQG